MRTHIYCNIIDNHGDVGVCWRLAQQLTGEHAHTVTLWVNDWPAARMLLPQLPEAAAGVMCDGVHVRPWAEAHATEDLTGDLTIEAFQCAPPAVVLAQLRGRAVKPHFVNLEYFSAEGWVDRLHLGSGIDPDADTRLWFFFPGVSEASGGLLRELGLLAERAGWGVAEADAFVQRLGLRRGPGLTHACFAYAHAPYAPWLEAIAPARAWALGAHSQRALGARASAVPWLSQIEFDRLLWSADVLWVRGEDSLVRALWAGHPMVWHIYPQAEQAHHAKLDAWLTATTAGWPPALAAALRDLHAAWNLLPAAPPLGSAWRAMLAQWPAWRVHATATRDRLAAQPDLVSRLLGWVG
jgi:hypothetical protein